LSFPATRVLLTGASSLLGWDILRHAPEHWNITATVHRNTALPPSIAAHRWLSMDITNHAEVEAVVSEIRPEVILHLGSLGNLDYCKDHPDEAWAVNVEGTRNLLECAKPYASVFVFTSTMYVVDGTHPPYAEDAPTGPLNEYARTKLAAEKLVLELNPRPVILRLMTMYGWHAPGQRLNWVTWLLNKLRNHEPCNVVNDVFNNYLWVGDASQATIASVENHVSGVFHIGGSEVASRFDFSKEVATVFGEDPGLISPVTSAYFSTIAQRPGNSTCSIVKMREVLGVHPLNIRQGLELMRSREAGFMEAVRWIDPEPNPA
jgi:dTDP-4-dehydrorhamnose reductase